jgi:signal transduction histidine kinase
MDDKLLLADDEEGIRKVLGIALADSGYEVLTAENGLEALRIFREAQPAIVLTDIKMPGLDGVALLRRIKAERPDTEVIMITGHGDMELAIESLKLEATDFVTKPINDEILEIALKRARERISMRRQIREYTENLERLVEEKASRLIEAERLAAVGQTVAELSHTIKNIANSLKGSIFVLGKGIELDEREYILQGWRMVEGSLEKIKNLSLDLLHYGKYAKIQTALTHPNTPAEEVSQLMTNKAQAEDVDLQIQMSPDLEPIPLDAEAIQRCLMNLVANAMDACRENSGGKRVILQSLPSEGWGVEYRVVDNGCGMDESVRERLFQSFFSTKGTDGTGIGLMMAKRIVGQHQGTIEVDSRAGEGTTIIIRLPGRIRKE